MPETVVLFFCLFEQNCAGLEADHVCSERGPGRTLRYPYFKTGEAREKVLD